MLRQFVMMACVCLAGPALGQDRWNGLEGLREGITRDSNTDWLRNYPIAPLPDYRRDDTNREIMRRLDDIDRKLYEQDQARTRRAIDRAIR